MGGRAAAVGAGVAVAAGDEEDAGGADSAELAPESGSESGVGFMVGGGPAASASAASCPASAVGDVVIGVVVAIVAADVFIDPRSASTSSSSPSSSSTSNILLSPPEVANAVYPIISLVSLVSLAPACVTAPWPAPAPAPVPVPIPGPVPDPDIGPAPPTHPILKGLGSSFNNGSRYVLSSTAVGHRRSESGRSLRFLVVFEDARGAEMEPEAVDWD